MPAATRVRSAVIGATAVALGIVGCSGKSSTAGSQAGASYSYRGTEPQNPLQPANSNETGGGRVVQNLFRGLVDYDPANGSLRMQVAAKIDTTDSQTYNVTLKSGWTFHDGTPVTAKSFVNSWNWSASTKNNQINSSWFSDIQGYADVHPKTGSPTAETMSGLTVADDTHFTIKLANKVSYFEYKLGYIAFSPLPDGFFKDPAGYGQKPVGNGPYQFVSWDHNAQIVTKAYPNYQGVDKPKNGGVVFKMYTTSEAAYADLQSNNLDMIDQVPPSALANYRADLGSRAIDAPQGAIQMLAFTLNKPDWSGAGLGKVRQGLSLAIDRETIARTVFQGARSAADSWTAQGVAGYKADTCAGFCKLDVSRAKSLIQEGGGVPGNMLRIAYNADGGHKEWVDAVCNNIRQNTGVNCVGEPKTDFKTFRSAVTTEQLDGAFRMGWVQDYPLNVNFLRDIYVTGAGSNDMHYSNQQFDADAKKADSAGSVQDSVTGYQKAEALLANDMPTIPLWYYRTNAGYSTKVRDVKFDSFGDPVWTDVQVKG